jgi:pilus assembly protein CpaF
MTVGVPYAWSVDVERRNAPEDSGWAQRLSSPAGDLAEYLELKGTVHRKLLDRINLEALSAIANERVRAEIRAVVAKLIDEEPVLLSLVEKERVTHQILDEVFGLGPIEPLLQDPTISEILVISPRQVYVERGGKIHRSAVEFRDDAHLLRIIEKMVSWAGRRVDESCPLVGVRLPDGSRVTAAVPPVVVDGPLLSIRRFRQAPITGEDLIAHLALTEPMMELLKSSVRAGLNILICGNAGAGKSTLLQTLCSYIPENRRIVTVEDASVLRLQQNQVIRMEIPRHSYEGNRAIHAREITAYALELRPDYIILDEVHGDEAIEVLESANRGRCSFLATVPGPTLDSALKRLEVMVTAGNRELASRRGWELIGASIDLLVKVSRSSDGSHRVTRIAEVAGPEQDAQVRLQDIFVFQETGFGERSGVRGQFIEAGAVAQVYDKIARKQESLSLSLESIAALNTPANLPQVFDVLTAACRAACELLKVDHVSVALFDSGLRMSRIEAEYPASFGTVGTTAPFTAQAARGGPLAIFAVAGSPDLPQDLFRDIYERLKIKSVLIVPITRGTRFIGSLMFDVVGQERHFSLEDTRVAQVFADQLRVVIDNAAHKPDLRAERQHMLLDIEHSLKTPLLAAYRKAQKLAEEDQPAREDVLAIRSLCAKAYTQLFTFRIFARLAAGEDAKPNLVWLTLAEVLSTIDNAVEDLEALGQQRRGRFHVDVQAARNVKIKTDINLLELAVRNLLDNAIKYSFGDSTIDVVVAEHGRLEISVRSKGLPLDPADRANAIKRGWRSASAMSISGDGLGLGLWLVDQAMKALSGQLVVNAREDITEVILEVPLAPHEGVNS